MTKEIFTEEREKKLESVLRFSKNLDEAVTLLHYLLQQNYLKDIVDYIFLFHVERSKLEINIIDKTKTGLILNAIEIFRFEVNKKIPELNFNYWGIDVKMGEVNLDYEIFRDRYMNNKLFTGNQTQLTESQETKTQKSTTLIETLSEYLISGIIDDHELRRFISIVIFLLKMGNRPRVALKNAFLMSIGSEVEMDYSGIID